jgi:nitroreductase
MRDWHGVFGKPNPATHTHTSIEESDLRSIVFSTLHSDTDLLLRPWRVIVIKDPARIQEIASAMSNSDILRSASVLIGIGIEQKQSHLNLARFIERLDSNQPGLAQYERYGALATDDNAYRAWLSMAAARCATRVTLAAKALGYAATILETFNSKMVRTAMAVPPDIDIPIIVSIGGTQFQREGETSGVTSDDSFFLDRWDRKLSIADGEESTKYRDCLISYFDILGFKGMIDNWAPHQIGVALTELLSLSSHDSNLRRATRRGLSTFSDHVVRTVELGGLDDDQVLATVEFELSEIQHVQANLAAKGVFVRGAVTRGPIHIDEEVVFGPGLVRGYELEQNTAIYPRIVFDELIVTEERRSGKNANKIEQLYSHHLFQGRDHIWSVNYLRAGDDLRETFKFLKLHAEILQKNISEISEPAVIAKYQWLAAFHDSVIDQISDSDLAQFGYSRPELLVS